MANVGSEIKKTLHLWNKNRSEWNIQRTRKETQKLKIQQIKYQTDSKVEKSPREYITKDRDMKNERWEKSADASTRPNIWIISSRRQKTEARHTPRHIFKPENENEASALEGVREKQHRSGNQNALKKVSPGCHVFPTGGHCFPIWDFTLANNHRRPERRPCQIHRYGHSLSGSYWRRSPQMRDEPRKTGGLNTGEKEREAPNDGEGDQRAGGPWAWQQPVLDRAGKWGAKRDVAKKITYLTGSHVFRYILLEGNLGINEIICTEN